MEAQNGCSQLHPDANLASSGSASENEFIANLHIQEQLWLGGIDSHEEGNWTWIDGTPFSYTNWQAGEGAGGPAENCLSTVHSMWYDDECFQSQYYVCKINLDHQ